LKIDLIKKTVKNIRQECYCNENGRLEDTANNLKQLYLSLDKDLIFAF
jgi:hypothetical protein